MTSLISEQKIEQIHLLAIISPKVVKQYSPFLYSGEQKSESTRSTEP
jgi:hypothetical protein